MMNKEKEALKKMSVIVATMISWCVLVPAHADEFAISIGDTVSDGVPGPGAGRLATAKEEDFYTFTATAAQLVFFESLSQDPAFKGSLRWQLIQPSGRIVFGSFFSNRQGRTVLPEAGTYKIRVYSDGIDPSWVGPYSFRTFPIPPDQTFPFAIGNVVSDGVPAAGAGRLEVAGSEDNYIFTAAAGQLAFFESLGQDPAFGGSLRWQLIQPSGRIVFASFFSNLQGRVLLPEAGEYRIRIYTDAVDSRWFGPYSFRAMPIPPDESFPYTIGTLVSDGVPVPGAGRLESAGSEESYVFTGVAGQVVFLNRSVRIRRLTEPCAGN
jgi:hypothetical protein